MLNYTSYVKNVCVLWLSVNEKRLNLQRLYRVKAFNGCDLVWTYIMAFTRRCVWDESNLAKFTIIVLNVATVDAPGVIISIPWRPCMHGVYLFECSRMYYIRSLCGNGFHIGVGSSLSVRQRWAMLEAWVRGTDRLKVSRFFFLSFP